MTKKSIIKQLLLTGIISAGCAFAAAVIVTGHFWDIPNIRFNIINLRVWTAMNRAYVLFFLFFFLGLHFVFPIRYMYNKMFEKRWVLGFFILLFVTANRWHGDSISCYDNVIQPGLGSESARPILGRERAIRSDEYVVTTPAILAAGYGEKPYGKYNDIMRGTDTLNIVSGIYAGCATIIYAPWELTYLILPKEYAFSFCWYAPLILGFLMSVELFYLIARQKGVAVTGALLIIMSSFYLWWGFSAYYFSAPGTIICIYYFLNQHERWKKVLFGLGTVVCFGNFLINIYPAWQVPLGYLFLVIGIWLLHENWDKIKQLKVQDWLMIAGCIIVLSSLIGSYFYSASEYVQAISRTVYPGQRIENGGFELFKLFYYAQAPFYAYKDIGNPSAAGVFFSLFPIPTLLAAYCWFQEKKKDWLTGGILLIEIPMLVYVTTGLPEIAARLLLFSYSTPKRLVDIIGLIQIYLIVITLSRYGNTKKFPFLIGMLLSAGAAGASIVISGYEYPGYLSFVQRGVSFLVIFLIGIGLTGELNEKRKKVLLFALGGVSIVTGIYVRPLMKGFDAIYSKPVAQEIRKICEEDHNAKWITQGLGIILPGYSVACGAPTVNSVNIYPNMELWHDLDPEKKYEEIYNRYAHVNVEFTNKETSFDIIYGDNILVNLSYRDVKKTEASYLLVVGDLNVDQDNGYVDFEKIYEEAGTSIYKMAY